MAPPSGRGVSRLRSGYAREPGSSLPGSLPRENRIACPVMRCLPRVSHPVVSLPSPALPSFTLPFRIEMPIRDIWTARLRGCCPEPKEPRDLWIPTMTPEGGVATDARPQPYLRTPYNESRSRFSPEHTPHWVAYQSDESGQFEVYIDAFPQSHDRKRISTGGGTYPQWGEGERELFCVSPDSKLMVADLKLTATSVEPSVPHELFRAACSGHRL
jgi:hypothetical protein